MVFHLATSYVSTPLSINWSRAAEKTAVLNLLADIVTLPDSFLILLSIPLIQMFNS